MNILYSDNHIVVCVKPIGVSSQDDGDSGMPALLRKSEKTDYIAPIHRLDRDVSGLMVYAKSKIGASKLSAQIQDGTLKKEYTAVVMGSPEEKSVELRDLLFHDKGKNKSYVVKRSRKGVREAILSYDVIRETELNGKKLSLVRILLVTGRTHQIRVQFSSRNMPLLGDRKYGGGGECPISLMSTRLSFIHPVTGKAMEFTLNLPESEPWSIFYK